MLEKKSSSEIQRSLLTEAAEAVSNLYLGDKFGPLFGPAATTENRDELWDKTAEIYPAFSENIKELRERLKVVDEEKKVIFPMVVTITRIPFKELEDKEARDFLGDILISRMVGSKKWEDNDINVVDEAKTMGKEMGLQNGWRSEQARKVTTKTVSSLILEGKLRIAPQPKR